jgi:copper(I)-binding protein
VALERASDEEWGVAMVILSKFNQVAAAMLLLACLLGSMACTGRAAGPQLLVEDAWARQPAVAGGNSAVYFHLRNRSGQADRLVGVSSPVATAELHQSVAREDGVMGMEPVSQVEIPAGGDIEFEPGGLHVMIMGLTMPLAAGDTLPLVLEFERSAPIELDVAVRAP